jgi:hypothetical protein
MDAKQFAAIMRITLQEQRKQMEQFFSQLVASEPPTVTEEIDAIDGRRVEFRLTDEITFDINQLGRRGDPATFLISQDGPLIQTHYPLVMWRPSGPQNADNLGQWSPVSSWPLPTQEVPNQDSINISYEVFDAGSQRFMQNEPSGPLFSRPDVAQPLPCPVVWAPNATIQFYPTYHDIFFNSNAQVPATEGILSITFPGYRIANL